MFGLQGPEAYAYTSSSNCLDVQDIDDVHDYKETFVGVLSPSCSLGSDLSPESHANHWFVGT